MVGAESGCVSVRESSRTVVSSIAGSNVSCPLNSAKMVFSSEQEQVASWLALLAVYRPPHFVHFKIIGFPGMFLN
jgi:hypothetical protein